MPSTAFGLAFNTSTTRSAASEALFAQAKQLAPQATIVEGYAIGVMVAAGALFGFAGA